MKSPHPFQADLFAVEMLNGYIYVHVDLGSGGVRVRASRRRVDDSHWHEFLLRRTGRDGRVTVDGANAEFKTPGESGNYINMKYKGVAILYWFFGAYETKIPIKTSTMSILN